MSKVGFSNYVIQRYRVLANRAHLVANDLATCPNVSKPFVENEYGKHLVRPVVEGPIELRNRDAINGHLNLRAALNGRPPAPS